MTVGGTYSFFNYGGKYYDIGANTSTNIDLINDGSELTRGMFLSTRNIWDGYSEAANTNYMIFFRPIPFAKILSERTNEYDFTLYLSGHLVVNDGTFMRVGALGVSSSGAVYGDKYSGGFPIYTSDSTLLDVNGLYTGEYSNTRFDAYLWKRNIRAEFSTCPWIVIVFQLFGGRTSKISEIRIDECSFVVMS